MSLSEPRFWKGNRNRGLLDETICPRTGSILEWSAIRRQSRCQQTKIAGLGGSYRLMETQRLLE
jgi:hypothetical protein